MHSNDFKSLPHSVGVLDVQVSESLCVVLSLQVWWQNSIIWWIQSPVSVMVSGQDMMEVTGSTHQISRGGKINCNVEKMCLFVNCSLFIHRYGVRCTDIDDFDKTSETYKRTQCVFWFNKLSSFLWFTALPTTKGMKKVCKIKKRIVSFCYFLMSYLRMKIIYRYS